MKKTAIIVIVMLIAVLFVTCDEFFPTGEKVEYTDVVYSEDGSRVTIYLDGVGVPVTKEQRAMSTRLSKMAYDYLDVVFVSGSTIARAQWDLGQAAGISGVDRGTAGIVYDATKALLAVGLKNGKTLLGVGEIMEVDNSASLPAGTGTGTGPGTTGWIPGISASGEPNSKWSTILPNSKSVTFYITAVKTGLLVEGETAGGATTYGGITLDSMDGVNWEDSARVKLGSAEVPAYPLTVPTAATPAPTTTATYEFYGAPYKYATQLLLAASGTEKVLVEPRFPRYMDNGSYKQLSATIDMRSEVKVTTQPTTGLPLVAANSAVGIPLTFTSKGSGIFSFYIEIPVYVLSTDEGTNAGALTPIKWRIRTGLGSELYSLDDGLAGGGCVLMTIGKLDLEDWLEIQWEWLP